MTGIAVQDLVIKLGGEAVLQGVNLSVRDGGFLAIVGPNGSGKTTLLRAMYQALRPASGAVLFGATDVTRRSASATAHLRAVVPQLQHADAGLTAAEIVATGLHSRAPWWSVARAHDASQVRAALARSAASHLGPRAFGSLSGGERQSVMLARALAQDAAALLLDEPTNHLDARAALALLELVASMPVTRVAVLHDLDLALAYADEVAVVTEGRIVAHGVGELVLTDALTREVFGVRSAIVTHPLTGRSHLLTAPLG